MALVMAAGKGDSDSADPSAAPPPRIRIAAVADVHSRAAGPTRAVEALQGADGDADLLLIAGDLTTHGRPEDAVPLADVCRDLDLPVFAVLGNHDWHEDRADEVVAVLEEAGVSVLQGEAAVCELHGVEVGIAGTKGFIGGFPGSHLPDFGEPSLRRVYREAGEEVTGLDRALREIAVCPLRLAMLHYAPLTETLAGERQEIWAFLGTDRLAAPILEHQPDLVVHGHAHAGRLTGRIGEVEVFNVSAPVLGRDSRPYWLFELEAAIATDSAIR